MNQVAQIYLGNIAQDSVLAKKITAAQQSQTVLEVYLKQSDRQKGRIATRSTCGIKIGIIKSRDFQLQEGDVFETNNHDLLLIHLQTEKLLVLDLPQNLDASSVTKLVSLGHLLGNHHYPIKIENNKIYVRVNQDSKVLLKAIAELNLMGLNLSWSENTSLAGMIQHTHTH